MPVPKDFQDEWDPELLGLRFRCIHGARGREAGEAGPHRFVVDDSGWNGPDQPIVVDVLTGTRWQQQIDSERRTLAQARQYCRGLDYYDVSLFWRLPTVLELAALFSDRRSFEEQVVDPETFPYEREEFRDVSFWSETASVDPFTSGHWTFDVEIGSLGVMPEDQDIMVRCVLQ